MQCSVTRSARGDHLSALGVGSGTRTPPSGPTFQKKEGVDGCTEVVVPAGNVPGSRNRIKFCRVGQGSGTPWGRQAQGNLEEPGQWRHAGGRVL